MTEVNTEMMPMGPGNPHGNAFRVRLRPRRADGKGTGRRLRRRA